MRTLRTMALALRVGASLLALVVHQKCACRTNLCDVRVCVCVRVLEGRKYRKTRDSSLFMLCTHICDGYLLAVFCVHRKPVCQHMLTQKLHKHRHTRGRTSPQNCRTCTRQIALGVYARTHSETGCTHVRACEIQYIRRRFNKKSPIDTAHTRNDHVHFKRRVAKRETQHPNHFLSRQRTIFDDASHRYWRRKHNLCSISYTISASEIGFVSTAKRINGGACAHEWRK